MNFGDPASQVELRAITHCLRQGSGTYVNSATEARELNGRTDCAGLGHRNTRDIGHPWLCPRLHFQKPDFFETSGADRDHFLHPLLYYHPEAPLWGAIYGSFLIMGANLIGLGHILYSRLPIGIPANQWPIFKALEGLEPGEFRQLMSLGAMQFADKSIRLTEEAAEVESLYFAISGDLNGDKGGRSFKMYAGEFIGEVSFMLGGKATASVTIEKGGVYYEWRKDKLRKVLENQPRLSQAFEALIGRDMAKKVASGYRAEELKVHSADVELQDENIGGKIAAPMSIKEA